MKVSSLFQLAYLAVVALSHPVIKRQAVSDTDILQFALTLEHLESAFYRTALQTLPQSDFTAAGLTDPYFQNIKQVAFDEQTHVKALTDALSGAGAQPVAPCTYDFGIKDINSFIATSNILEGVGTSAYLGAAPAISSKDILSTAGSILAVEALHTSLQRTTLGLKAAGNPFYPPIVPNGAFSLAAAFIKSCPDTNAPLPFKAFPTLTVTNPVGPPLAPGATVNFKAQNAIPDSAFVTFVSGIKTVSVKPNGSGTDFSAAVPDGLGGQTYVFITNAQVQSVSDDAVLFGPAVIETCPPAADLAA